MTDNPKLIAEEVIKLLNEAGPERLDPDEVRRLRSISESDMIDKVNDLHTALLKAPSDKEPTLLAQIREVIVAYNRASWLVRSALWLVPALALLITGWETVATSLSKLLGGSPQ